MTRAWNIKGQIFSCCKVKTVTNVVDKYSALLSISTQIRKM